MLEVGVGTGLSLPFYPEDCHVTGIDISEAMLEQARERLEDSWAWPEIDLRLMDATELSYPGRDVRSRAGSLRDFGRSRAGQGDGRDATRVCKPGGTVMVVNRFRSRHRVVRLLEKLLTPASQWIGFRLDVPLEVVTEAPGLEIVRVERVNLFGLWHLLELRRLD